MTVRGAGIDSPWGYKIVQKKRRLLTVVLAAIFIGPIGSTETLAPAEGKLQLSQVSELLAGRYDNDPQRHYLEGMKRGSSAPPRLHLSILRSTDGSKPTDGLISFALEEREGSEHSAVTRRGRLSLGTDPVNRHVVMKLDGEGLRCDWQWRRHNGVWLAEPNTDCARNPSAGIVGKKLWLGSDELWLESSPGEVMTELGRARHFECFIAARLRNGQPQIFNGLRVHDRGGTVEVTTKDDPVRKLTLTLRRGMWPSNSGNNLLELLTITVREEGEPSVVGSGWATPDSPRVGFGNEEVGIESGRSINARCKRVEE